MATTRVWLGRRQGWERCWEKSVRAWRRNKSMVCMVPGGNGEVTAAKRVVRAGPPSQSVHKLCASPILREPILGDPNHLGKRQYMN